eukprot:Platyproteum_vivax@DN16483_c0_g1_i1.p1
MQTTEERRRTPRVRQQVKKQSDVIEYERRVKEALKDSNPFHGQSEDSDFFSETDDDDEENFKKRKRKKTTTRHQPVKTSRVGQRRDLAVTLWADKENYLQKDIPVPFESISVPATRLPSRKYCSVCGFFGGLKCPKCQTQYCSSGCYAIHKDTKCL